MGLVYLKDLEKADKNEKIESYVNKSVPYVYTSSSLEEALEVMSKSMSEWVAVVEENNKLLGIITLESILNAYKKENYG